MILGPFFLFPKNQAPAMLILGGGGGGPAKSILNII
jgi:hypothetical protein